MICNKDNTQKYDGVSVRTWKVLAGGSEIFLLDEWVVKIDLLANRSTHWPVG